MSSSSTLKVTGSLGSHNPLDLCVHLRSQVDNLHSQLFSQFTAITSSHLNVSFSKMYYILIELFTKYNFEVMVRKSAVLPSGFKQFMLLSKETFSSVSLLNYN